MIKPDYFELIFRNWVKRVCLEVKGVVACLLFLFFLFFSYFLYVCNCLST